LKGSRFKTFAIIKHDYSLALDVIKFS